MKEALMHRISWTVSIPHRPRPTTRTGKPEESYGIGLGGDCGLS